jgi:hypothetical protein
MMALEEFRKESGLPDETFGKIKQFINANLTHQVVNVDFQTMLSEVPTSLKEEVMYF